MIHIGDKGFYHDLADSVSSGKTVILAEGVTDQDGLLTAQFGYDEVAETLGLTSQSEMKIAGRLVDEAELTQLGPADFETLEPHIIRADSDLNRFSPSTLEFINMLGKHLFNNESLPEGLQAYDAWAREHVTPETTEALMADLLQSRNAVVISWLDRVLPLYDTIVIPWGALHMPGIEAAILERGFRLTSSKERLSVDFASLPIEQLLEKLSTPTVPKSDETVL